MKPRIEYWRKIRAFRLKAQLQTSLRKVGHTDQSTFIYCSARQTYRAILYSVYASYAPGLLLTRPAINHATPRHAAAPAHRPSAVRVRLSILQVAFSISCVPPLRRQAERGGNGARFESHDRDSKSRHPRRTRQLSARVACPPN